LWLIWIEVETVVRRTNERMASEATLLQAAAASVLSPKEGGGFFRKLVSKLVGG